MAFLECIAPPRRREAQEEVLADLNTCIEQLSARTLELEARIAKCTEHALLHGKLAIRSGTSHVVQARERQRAKMYLLDKRRIQAEHDKGLRMIHLLEAQIDSIMSSHVDSLVIQTMRSYNSTALRLAAPALTSQLENLSDELSDRSHELHALQEALNDVASSMNVTNDNRLTISGEGNVLSEDAQLALELDELLGLTSSSSSSTPFAAASTCTHSAQMSSDAIPVLIINNNNKNNRLEDNDTSQVPSLLEKRKNQMEYNSTQSQSSSVELMISPEVYQST